MTPKEANAKLEAAAAALPGVERKRMPGGYALFTAGKIFANVTLDGRIGLKLPVAWCFEDLAALPGAGPWKLGQRVMDGWVLVPESFHTSDATLLDWVARAHACAIGKMPAERPAPVAHAAAGALAVDEADADDSSEGPQSESPPTARSRGTAAASIVPTPRATAPAVIIDDEPSKAYETPPLSRRSGRPIVPAPPSSRNGLDFSSYAPPPPSSLGIRVVPRDSKSPFEETLIGVPAPSSSSEALEEINEKKKKKRGDGG